MSKAQLLSFETERARMREVAAARKKAMEDVSAEDILALSVKRELKSAEVEGVGKVYFYEPMTVAERDAYHKHIRADGDGVRITMEAMVDGMMARLRNKNGKLLFEAHHRARVLSMPAETLLALWHALGSERAEPSIEAAEKK